jgi:hypothetical protein
MGLFKRRERDPNEWRWHKGAWRNGHGDVMYGRCIVIASGVAQIPPAPDRIPDPPNT